MKDRQPWSVRGVTREARAKAARAASQQHKTIGEWVTQTLIAAADRDLGLVSELPSQAGSPATNLPARQDGQAKELTLALGALVQHLEKSAQANDVTARLERTEHALMGRMEQMAAGLYSLMQTMETRAMPVIEGESGARLMLPDESRLAEAVEKVVGAEGRRQDQMEAIAEALSLLAAKVGDADVAAQSVPAVETEIKTEDASDAPSDNQPAQVGAEEPRDDDKAAKPVEPPPIAARFEANPPAEPAEPEATDTSVEADSPSPVLNGVAGERDGDGDVVAAIRARSAGRASDGSPQDPAPKRGLIGRLLRLG